MTMANDLQDRERGKQTGHQSGYPMHVETPVAVSVVVMSYNNARFIGETIESVRPLNVCDINHRHMRRTASFETRETGRAGNVEKGLRALCSQP